MAEDWRERGFSCQQFADQPGQQWRDFTHSTNELVTVVEGVLDVRVGKIRTQLRAGDEIFIAKGVSHDIINIHNGTTRWLYGYD